MNINNMGHSTKIITPARKRIGFGFKLRIKLALRTLDIDNNDGVYYLIEIVKQPVRNKNVHLFDSVGAEAMTTISALPSGAPCGCCNGSGRSI